MADVLPLKTRSLREQVSVEEWETRVDLAACYRLVALYGMTDLVYNHITARVPRSDHVLINPYGMLYDEITASNLIKIDLDGNVVLQPDHGYSVNAAGYVPFRWTVDTLGWKGTSGGIDAATVLRRVLDTAQPGQIVLMHVGANPTDGTTLDADALPRVIEELSARGYGFVDLREMLP